MKIKLSAGPLAQELTDLMPNLFSFKEGVEAHFEEVERIGYKATYSEGSFKIEVGSRSDKLLALGDLAMMSTPMNSHKSPGLYMRGFMLDVSRNGVVKVSYLKQKLTRLALMGMNYFCLYTEDTFPFPEEPLFGYGRGGYTVEEIRELVDFGKILGVTLFPCIQTLGHLEQILKFPKFQHLKDNEYIGNVYKEEFYDLLDRMIESITSLFDTNLIHIGMDETHGLARGSAFKENEPINPRMVYLKHLNRIVKMCESKDLKPMMWGDIIMGTTVGETQMSEEEMAYVPKEVVVDYWDYHQCDEKIYEEHLNAIVSKGYEAVVSPGAWCWTRFFPSYEKASKNIITLLNSAKKVGIHGAMTTQWGDDGHECLFDYNIPANALFLTVCVEDNDYEEIAKQKVKTFFGADYDLLVHLSRIDDLGEKSETLSAPNIGKCLVYEDPVTALVSGCENFGQVQDYYQKLSESFYDHGHDNEFRALFDFAGVFCEYAAIKSSLHGFIKEAYDQNDFERLKLGLKKIDNAHVKARLLKNMYSDLWIKERKVFGLEMIEGRWATQVSRLEFLSQRIQSYLSGAVTRLEELEMQHLDWEHGVEEPNKWHQQMLHYSQIFSRSGDKLWWW
jgi:hypothetical protein